MFKGAQIGRSLIVSAISLGLGSAAFAAESMASTMAGSDSGSSAQMGATTAAGGLGASESTTQNNSSSSNERSSSASAQNSAQMSSMPTSNTTELSVRNLPANGGSPVRGSSNGLSGSQPVQAGNGLIQNSVKPYNDNDATGVKNTSTTIDRASSMTTTTGPTTAPAARVPHAKVQYWNRTTKTTTRHR